MPMKDVKIDLVHGAGRPSFRTKEVCLSVQDWLDVDAVFKERFPQAAYIRTMTWKEMIGSSPPSIPTLSRLSEFLDDKGRLLNEIWIGFDPDYRLVYERPTEAEKYYYFKWKGNGAGLPRIRLSPGGFPTPADKRGPERLYGGRIEMSLSPGNESHRVLVQQYFGIIRRHVSKEPLLRVEYPSYEARPSSRTAALEWIGKDAMRWAREDPKRLLCPDLKQDGTGGWGYRPLDA